MKWGLNNNNNNIKSAEAPKVKKDYSAKPKSKKERQKTIKTDASLVDKLGALQMALGDKNRTETFRRLLKAGVGQLLKGKPKHIKRYRDAFKLIHR